MKFQVVKQLFILCNMMFLMCLSTLAQSQTFPNKPVKLVVGFPPGGMADIVARELGERLSIVWKQSVIIENKPGASGTIAADAVAKANPDGYSLLVILTNHVVVASIRQKLPYDSFKDFAPVSLVGDSPLVLMANPKLPANNLAQLVSLAKSKPGIVTYSTPGDGSIHHLSQELMDSTLGIKMVHVPYIGGAPAMLDTMTGVVDLNIGSPSQAIQQIKAGKLKAISYSGLKRSPLLPEVPTVAETLIPGFQAALWAGVLAPAKTPRDLINKIQSDIKVAMSGPEIKDKMDKLGIEIISSSPEEFDQYLKSEFNKWSNVARQANIKSE
ncbi:tripartite tricarboxylate transporter substrate binding protein [Polynucleobacter rarus]|uniref:tripartite tricarboxylate transporter substrate binding protein n=1 Tax=Polynucleobacter rarus TaxID=556055 RepID=UPI000D3ECFF9|nr:tripartite tricarboxylate transporter substrate binding protein [Polynucleobacter rarus]